MTREPIFFKRPVRDHLFERKPAANPYEHATQLLARGELANSIVILQGIVQKTGCEYCAKQIEEVIIPAIERNEVDRAIRLIKGLQLTDETIHPARA